MWESDNWLRKGIKDSLEALENGNYRGNSIVRLANSTCAWKAWR